MVQDPALAALISRLVAPLLTRHGGQLVSVEHNGNHVGESP